MKIKSNLSLLTFLLMPAFVFSQITNLNIPNDLCITSQPSQGKEITYSVIMVESACLEMMAANPNTNAKRLESGKTRMTESQRSSIIGVVKLQSINTEGSKKSLNFGLKCAEAGDDDANVLIEFGNKPADDFTRGPGMTPIKLNIPANQVLTVADGNFPADGNITQNYLRVNADRNRTATFNIEKNENQGQVIVGIYRVNGNPNPLAILDPKTFTFHSYTADQDVFVVPLIRPKQVDNGGKTEIHFEVGDPHENGQVEVEEEGG